jgi:hypothetical protein
MKPVFLFFCAAICLHSMAQQPSTNSRKKLPPDSVTLEWKDGLAEELPVIMLADNGKADPAISYLPSVLAANRDVFSSTASFHFNVVHFRPRGYDGRWSGVLINGLPMNSPADGLTPWSYWTGLNDVTKNTQSVNGFRPGDMDIGNPGSTTLICALLSSGCRRSSGILFQTALMRTGYRSRIQRL